MQCLICIVKPAHPITDSKELGYMGKLVLKKTPFFSLMFSISVTAMTLPLAYLTRRTSSASFPANNFVYEYVPHYQALVDRQHSSSCYEFFVLVL